MNSYFEFLTSEQKHIRVRKQAMTTSKSQTPSLAFKTVNSRSMFQHQFMRYPAVSLRDLNFIMLFQNHFHNIIYRLFIS